MTQIPGWLFGSLLAAALLGQSAPCRGQEPSAPPQEQVYPVFKLGGFHDVTYTANRRNAPHGFTLGQFVLHANSLLSNTMQFFGEVSFTARTDAGAGSPAAPGYNADIERAILRYDFSDQLRLSTGRYHTPINWWNTAYHHGQWLQTTIARPEMVRFGGQFIPVHFVGGLVEGVVRGKEMGISYKAGVGNGRGPVASRAGDAGDDNATAAWLLNLSIRPERIYGLQVGGSLYRDALTPIGGPRIDETIVAAHVALETETPEFLAEYARVHHDPQTGPSIRSDAYYVQVAYRLAAFNRKLKPYFRIERMRVPVGEPIFTATPSLRGGLGGVRYDFSDFAALKLEYRNLRRSTGPNNTGLVTQISYTF